VEYFHGRLKSEQGVGSGVAVFAGRVLTEKLKFQPDNRCSKNQAEQLDIVKALEVIEMQQVNHNEHKAAVIYTLESIRSVKNHNHLVEEIRNRGVTLNKKNWKIEFKWVKAQAGIHGNEIADRLAKEATQNDHVTYSRIPKSTIIRDNRKESIRK
jgi:ribonuclease HI